MRIILYNRVVGDECYDIKKDIVVSDLSPIPREGEFVETAEGFNADKVINVTWRFPTPDYNETVVMISLNGCLSPEEAMELREEHGWERHYDV